MADLSLVFDLLARDRASSTFRDVGSAAEQAGDKGSRFGGAIKAGAAVAGGALVVAGAAAGRFGLDAVNAFAAVEDATGANSVIFGEQSKAVVAFADKASSAFGLSKVAALEAAGTFGTLGKAAGLSGTDLAGFSTKFTGLAGDLASFKGTSPETAIQAIGAALRGETEPIRQFGVLLDDAALRNEALAQGLIKTTKDALTPQQKSLAAQALILKQTTDAQGDFARTSDSTANTQKRLTAATDNAKAALGERLAPAVTFVRQAILNLVQGSTVFIDTASRVLGPLIENIKAKFGKGAGLEGTVTSLSSFITGTLVPTFQRIASFVTTVVVPAVTTLVSGALAGLKRAFDTIRAAVDDNREQLVKIGQVILAVAGFVVRNLAPVLGGVLKTALTNMGTAISTGIKLIGKIVDAFERVADVVRSVIGAFGRLADAIRSLPTPKLPDLPGIPGFASGGILPRGLAVVGERGPELIASRGGARVFSNRDSTRLLEGVGPDNSGVEERLERIEAALYALPGRHLVAARAGY